MALPNSSLRRLLAPLRRTPLHPQWLVFRDEPRVRHWVRERAHGRVLDIGAADGWARRVISSDCTYVGLDYAVTATEMYHTSPDVFADGAQLPFSDESFDTVLLLEVLEHVARPADVLCEIRRVLGPDGTLLLSMPFLYPLHDAPHDYQRYTSPGLTFALAQAGLLTIEPMPRNRGFEAAALLCAIASADAIISALETRRWRLLFAPLLLLAIPVANIAGWLLSPLSGSNMLATGHAVEAHRS
ncbi:MAG TPA: class I SAM-dependent methyltransferase [Rhodanobacteraceae bacterium]|nr:class I SAM-dependent methyltransferase [Rhodanobacteraceae bacterium]